MLQMRSSCGECGPALAYEDAAFICSYECTSCATCVERDGFVCPNCGGELVRRPRRTPDLADADPTDRRYGACMRSLQRLGASALACLALAACSGSSSHATAASRVAVAQRVCRAELRAAAVLLPGARVRIADSEPWSIECVVSRGRIKVDTIAQAQALAAVQWGEVGNHFIQSFGTGPVHVPSMIPQLCCPSLDSEDNADGQAFGNAFWVPMLKEVFTTNGTDTRGGSYVTSMVKGPLPRAASLALATAVARATLNVAPRGPNHSPQ